jgi:uncharacterized protein YjiS (DUF1127 family)
VSNQSATIFSLSPPCPSRGIQPSAIRTRLSLVYNRITGTPAMALIQFVRLVAMWRRFNSLLDRLDRMSDRELAERGIIRSDVIRFAMEHSER